MRMLLEQYVEGWKSRHIEAVLDTLANDCVVMECYGPVCKGRGRIHQWMEAWLAEGGRILEWDIRSFVGGRNAAAIEWTFRCWRQEDDSRLMEPALRGLTAGKSRRCTGTQ